MICSEAARLDWVQWIGELCRNLYLVVLLWVSPCLYNWFRLLSSYVSHKVNTRCRSGYRHIAMRRWQDHLYSTYLAVHLFPDLIRSLSLNPTQNTFLKIFNNPLHKIPGSHLLLATALRMGMKSRKVGLIYPKSCEDTMDLSASNYYKENPPERIENS